jgi:hypothetical protein
MPLSPEQYYDAGKEYINAEAMIIGATSKDGTSEFYTDADGEFVAPSWDATPTEYRGVHCLPALLFALHFALPFCFCTHVYMYTLYITMCVHFIHHNVCPLFARRFLCAHYVCTFCGSLQRQ